MNHRTKNADIDSVVPEVLAAAIWTCSRLARHASALCKTICESYFRLTDCFSGKLCDEPPTMKPYSPGEQLPAILFDVEDREKFRIDVDGDFFALARVELHLAPAHQTLWRLAS